MVWDFLISSPNLKLTCSVSEKVKIKNAPGIEALSCCFLVYLDSPGCFPAWYCASSPHLHGKQSFPSLSHPRAGLAEPCPLLVSLFPFGHYLAFYSFLLDGIIFTEVILCKLPETLPFYLYSCSIFWPCFYPVTVTHSLLCLSTELESLVLLFLLPQEEERWCSLAGRVKGSI